MTFSRGTRRRPSGGATRPGFGKAAALVGVALLLAGCGGNQRTGQAASAGVTSSPSPTPAACARDEPYYQAGLLQTEDVWTQGGRSQERTIVVELDPKACASGTKVADVPVESCRAADFPWTTSAASASRELAGAGVRAWGDVTHTAGGRTLQETVLAPSPSDEQHALAAAYRDHLRGCEARAVGGHGGKSDWLRLGDSAGQLLVSFHDGVVIALRADRAQWTDAELGEVMRLAESRSEKFME
ncbi:hypothetical protein [Streptomyces dubilierae]|uniref:DUF3558 domain-containing protein n=1 Tax=Streptomyces dubilierae TaxID=3075533 RepID=A0ABU2PFL4_9ACTN|nr:hypothetical protein [Streptomyces sp. DSM 41921]MDT0390943.1 hypothetical protein [Streptomyces sp. DSM 41921]